MTTAICTLFEGNYHYGLGAFINSLARRGFQGSVYAGYRGQLPPWSSAAGKSVGFTWANASTLQITDKIQVHFLPVDTAFHLTNYKPFFMLDVFAGPAANADALLYFDPDIIVKCKWEFFEKWVHHGIAVVHDVLNQTMSPTHPIRGEWAAVIEKMGMKPANALFNYFNGGFVGVSKANMHFLKIWADVINTGVKFFEFPNGRLKFKDSWDVFFRYDQDALNIAAMCTTIPISDIGPEAMDFISGGFTMSHAVGWPKPWKKNFLKLALRGEPPGMADKNFWKNVNHPISLFPKRHTKWKRLQIKIAAFIGRFYKRS